MRYTKVFLLEREQSGSAREEQSEQCLFGDFGHPQEHAEAKARFDAKLKLGKGLGAGLGTAEEQLGKAKTVTHGHAYGAWLVTR